MTLSERAHWLGVTEDPDYKRNHITDASISEDETVRAIVASFPPHPGAVLEVGCGYGRLTTRIKDLYPTAKVIGIDVNPNLLAEAAGDVDYQCRDDLHGISGLDAVYSVAVFQHLPTSEKRAYIDGAFEALNAGGVLRVQFIEGERDNFVDHLCPGAAMVDWFASAGFDAGSIERGLAHEQWSWITGVKP